MHSEGTRVRSLFRSFINPPPWIQPASIPLPTPALRPTALPWPCSTHKRTQTGRNLVVRAHRSSPYVLIQFLIPLRPLLHPPPPTHPSLAPRPRHYASRPFICFPVSPCRRAPFFSMPHWQAKGGEGRERDRRRAGHPRRFNMESRKHAVSRKRMAGNKDWDGRLWAERNENCV